MNIPKHVAIIMDGNGRWATNKGLKRSAGHLEGSKTLEKLSIHAFNKGIKVLSVYAFSTDNFKRSKEEIDYLMNLFIKMFNSKTSKIVKNGIKVVFSGRRINLRNDVLNSMDKLSEKTKNNKNGILNICLNYGGQEEIIDAAIKLAKDINKGKKMTNFTREDFYDYLYQKLPPIDFIIRTGSEQRVSNFMLYQMSYSELYFTDTFFPDFKENEFDKTLMIFSNRHRKYGK